MPIIWVYGNHNAKSAVLTTNAVRWTENKEIFSMLLIDLFVVQLFDKLSNPPLAFKNAWLTYAHNLGMWQS